MKVYRAEYIAKDDGQREETYIAEADDLEEYDTNIERYGITDDDVHFCFLPVDKMNGKHTYETDEFKYVILDELELKENE